MIRQAISCDICGAEKKQTNHWFVGHEHGGEMRVSGWDSRNRMRPGSKHLCGQTCLHKLVDDFMARDVAARMRRGVVDEVDLEEQARCTDGSLTSNAAYVEMESSARLVTRPAPSFQARLGLPAGPLPVMATLPAVWKAGAEMVAMPVNIQADEESHAEETPVFRSRKWRAEAWGRERDRELRAGVGNRISRRGGD